MQRLGLGEHAKKSAHCPFHQDRHNSFSVWQSDSGFWRFKCHAGCGDGAEITFLELYEPRGTKTRALVIGNPINGQAIHIFESYWDAFALMDVLQERSRIIITRGAGNGGLVKHHISAGVWPIYLWTQNDDAGEKWQKD